MADTRIVSVLKGHRIWKRGKKTYTQPVYGKAMASNRSPEQLRRDRVKAMKGRKVRRAQLIAARKR